MWILPNIGGTLAQEIIREEKVFCLFYWIGSLNFRFTRYSFPRSHCPLSPRSHRPLWERIFWRSCAECVVLDECWAQERRKRVPTGDGGNEENEDTRKTLPNPLAPTVIGGSEGGEDFLR
jgi:hypothetical protein